MLGAAWVCDTQCWEPSRERGWDGHRWGDACIPLGECHPLWVCSHNACVGRHKCFTACCNVKSTDMREGFVITGLSALSRRVRAREPPGMLRMAPCSHSVLQQNTALRLPRMEEAIGFLGWFLRLLLQSDDSIPSSCPMVEQRPSCTAGMG